MPAKHGRMYHKQANMYQNEIKRREEQFTEIEKPVHALIPICGDPFEQVKAAVGVLNINFMYDVMFAYNVPAYIATIK